jgi:hypothetical protein
MGFPIGDVYDMFSFMIHNALTTLAAAASFSIGRAENMPTPFQRPELSLDFLKSLKATKDTISL